jgi:hypothetical protein
MVYVRQRSMRLAVKQLITYRSGGTVPLSAHRIWQLSQITAVIPWNVACVGMRSEHISVRQYSE